MKSGFVIGKFMPLHEGHLALIRFAASQCDHLDVILCHSSNETIPGNIRHQWLEQELRFIVNVSIIVLEYNEKELPNTSVSSKQVSAKWAKALKMVVPQASLVISSEEYGDYLAEDMGIKHILFDHSRREFPVSGSAIRANPFKYWQYLADSAKPFFVKKIVLLGTESTGKSTLAEKLAAHYHTVFVAEAAREIIEKTDACAPSHLQQIAVLHAERIRRTLPRANKLLFIDTDIHITKSYSHYLFNEEMVVSPDILEVNKADLYLYLDANCPFVQDGTRLCIEKRNQLDEHHRQELLKEGITYESVCGNWEQRFKDACDIINRTFDLAQDSPPPQ